MGPFVERIVSGRFYKEEKFKVRPDWGVYITVTTINMVN